MNRSRCWRRFSTTNRQEIRPACSQNSLSTACFRLVIALIILLVVYGFKNCRLHSIRRSRARVVVTINYPGASHRSSKNSSCAAGTGDERYEHLRYMESASELGSGDHADFRCGTNLDLSAVETQTASSELRRACRKMCAVWHHRHQVRAQLCDVRRAVFSRKSLDDVALAAMPAPACSTVSGACGCGRSAVVRHRILDALWLKTEKLQSYHLSRPMYHAVRAQTRNGDGELGQLPSRPDNNSAGIITKSGSHHGRVRQHHSAHQPGRLHVARQGCGAGELGAQDYAGGTHRRTTDAAIAIRLTLARMRWIRQRGQGQDGVVQVLSQGIDW